MADMIDAAAAKARLGIDDATLQSYINNGTIRAQRAGGKILCNEEDVEKLAGGSGGDDEGTIVLTGDSDDLSIDLGKVVDDSSPTIVQSKTPDDSSITFGDELEVVSFDDNAGTSELSFDDTQQTGQAGSLSFTDSNTAVMTAVDETAVGATTAPLDFQTQPEGPSPTAASARRSVRSNRMVMREEQPTHWIWPTLLVTTVLIAAFLMIPYYVMSVVQKEDGQQYNGDRALGARDNGWTSMAGGIAGFSVEPNEKRFREDNPGGEFRDLAKVEGGDDQAVWRHRQYRGDLKDPAERVESFWIDKISEDGKTATAKGGRTYPIIESSEQLGDGGEAIKTSQVKVW